jgi:hypothetical protein
LLAKAHADFLNHFGLNAVTFSVADTTRRFSISSKDIRDRFDAEPFSPCYRAWRTRIRAAGGGTLSEIAQVHKPYGRYKTNYVTDSRYGIKMMNGRQISQYRPIALQLMSPAALAKPKSFELSAGTTLLTADGRAEENLADCALVGKDREGWAASGHVHRVRPLSGVHPGLIYLACSCRPVQALLKAQATGSVVDALSEVDVSCIPVPYDDGAAARKIGDKASLAWNLFCESAIAEGEAVAALEYEFSGGTR